MKECKQCKITKPLAGFYKAKGGKQGVRAKCKECEQTSRKILQEKYYEKNKERLKEHYKTYRANNKSLIKEKAKQYREANRDKINLQKREAYHSKDIRKRLWEQAKARAKNKNIAFNIEITDIIIPEICPYLKVPFIEGSKDNYEYTYSLDRIINSKGYVKGNIQVITKKANSMKNSASKAELIKFAKVILQQFKDDDIVRPILKNIELEDKEPQG